MTVVAVSLDLPDLEWIDSSVSTLKATDTGERGLTRSSVIRLAVRRVDVEYEGLDVEVLMVRFGVAWIEVPDRRTYRSIVCKCNRIGLPPPLNSSENPFWAETQPGRRVR
jgi:hypothetical protein